MCSGPLPLPTSQAQDPPSSPRHTPLLLNPRPSCLPACSRPFGSAHHGRGQGICLILKAAMDEVYIHLTPWLSKDL